MVPARDRCAQSEAWLSGDHRAYEGAESDQAGGEEDRFRYGSGGQGEHLKIYHGQGFIDIDCGCGYDMPIKNLACIRLEDMFEYYQ